MTGRAWSGGAAVIFSPRRLASCLAAKFPGSNDISAYNRQETIDVPERLTVSPPAAFSI
jgi:hypothetical protein